MTLQCRKCWWTGRRKPGAWCPACGQAMLLPRQPETGQGSFQNQVTDLATLYGWFWDHDTDSRRKKAGWPDLTMIRVGVGGGVMIWVELKVPPYECTPSQLAMHDRLRAVGQTVHVWRPADWPEIVRVLTGRPS